MVNNDYMDQIIDEIIIQEIDKYNENLGSLIGLFYETTKLGSFPNYEYVIAVKAVYFNEREYKINSLNAILDYHNDLDFIMKYLHRGLNEEEYNKAIKSLENHGVLNVHVLSNINMKIHVYKDIRKRLNATRSVEEFRTVLSNNSVDSVQLLDEINKIKEKSKKRVR